MFSVSKNCKNGIKYSTTGIVRIENDLRKGSLRHRTKDIRGRRLFRGRTLVSRWWTDFVTDDGPEGVWDRTNDLVSGTIFRGGTSLDSEDGEN